MVYILSAGFTILMFWLWKISQEKETDNLIAKRKIEDFQLHRNNNHLNRGYIKVQSLYNIIRRECSSFNVFDEDATEIWLKMDYNYHDANLKFKLSTMESVNDSVTIEVYFEGKNRKEKHIKIDLNTNSEDIWKTIKIELEKITLRE